MELLPGQLTPGLQEMLVRLASWMPFAAAGQVLLDFMQLQSLSAATVRRHTERAGAVQVGLQEAAVVSLEQGGESAVVTSEQLAVEVDGAMVPLVGGEWAEAKTLIIGRVAAVAGAEGVGLAEISSFSRLNDSQRFTREALVETLGRGVVPGAPVALVGDGAEWIQSFGDYHCPDAVRILDFPHAASYLAEIGQGVFGAASPEGSSWLQEQLDCLKHQGGSAVLPGLRRLIANQELDLSQPLAYLEKREDQMEYPEYQRQGWPIASGGVESANKLVVQARLKGAGMHWAREQVNPMLALRNIVCSDRWAESWPHIAAGIRQQAASQRRARRQQRQVARAPAPLGPAVAAVGISQESVAHDSTEPQQHWEVTTDQPQVKASRRPAPDHPWRRSPIGRSRFQFTASPKI